MKKRIVSAMLAAMMVFSVGTTALAGVGGTDQGGSVGVSTEVKPPIYKVSVPTNLKFYIDPFEQLGNGASITSDDFAFINKSNVAIKLDVALKATKGNDVTFVADAVDVTETDTQKLAFLQAEVPKTVVETPAAGAAYVDSEDFTTELTMYKNGTGAYYLTSDSSSGEAAVTSEMIDVTSAKGTYTDSYPVDINTTNGTTLTFALDGADYIDYYTNSTDTEAVGTAFKTVAASQASSAVFRFTGEVNTKADWQAADMGATVTYAFNGLTSDNYDTAIADPVDVNAHALTGAEDIAAPTTRKPSIATTSYDMYSGKAFSVTCDYGLGDGVAADGITKIVNKKSGSLVPTTRYKVQDGVITFDATFATNNLTDAKVSGGLNLDVVFNDAAATTVTINLTGK